MTSGICLVDSRWRMMTVLQRGGRQEFDLDGGNVPFCRMIATLPGQAEVETRLFLHQLQHLALDTVRRRCRFRGWAYQACLYIAEQLLAAEKVDLDRRRALGLAKPPFYRDYVLVILRAFLADFYQRYRQIVDENYWFRQTWVTGFFAEKLAEPQTHADRRRMMTTVRTDFGSSSPLYIHTKCHKEKPGTVRSPPFRNSTRVTSSPCP